MFVVIVKGQPQVCFTRTELAAILQNEQLVKVYRMLPLSASEIAALSKVQPQPK
jgi:hypothetical protein